MKSSCQNKKFMDLGALLNNKSMCNTYKRFGGKKCSILQIFIFGKIPSAPNDLKNNHLEHCKVKCTPYVFYLCRRVPNFTRFRSAISHFQNICNFIILLLAKMFNFNLLKNFTILNCKIPRSKIYTDCQKEQL